ncbi:alkaline phosphatase family protein [Shewanella surugensis]|uniref:Alkaline phosphatase family protein n=1 Tax=Shewanella surugensis TaxID=212020 RepID=A0ABT0LC41_9GAMM|nr:alkaline phosphatase family protein [Shewanella surugensis]MCL1125234.1 alkaline phosphatase family protein [Shewanella surugensis]
MQQHTIKTFTITFTTILFLLLLSVSAHAQYHKKRNPPPKKPKLILQITVDALRGDLLTRYAKNMRQGGFKYLLNKGIVYNNAHYQHANTETIVGHVSLATGAPPTVHGMVGNIWFERSQNRIVYNIEDPHYSLLTKGAGVDSQNEIDPTQRAAKNEGRSPMAILSTTISDEIASAFPRSNIFAVSIKDRGAVSFAGQYGKAFWFSKASAEFVTSNYYYQTYPDWVNHWNQSNPTKKYHNTQWTRSLDQDQYVHVEENQPSLNPDYKTDIAGFSTRFPHPYGPSDDKYFTTKLTLSPAGDDLTLSFAKTLIENEHLGKDEIPDYLSISFSSNDYVLHLFGPSSQEAEDNLLRLDLTLKDLFSYIDEKIGLDNTLIILSADHGAPEIPGYLVRKLATQLTTASTNKAHYFSLAQFQDENLFTAIEHSLGLKKGQGKTLIQRYAHPYVYLEHSLIKKYNLDLKQVQISIANEIMKLNGVEYAIPSTQIATGQLPQTHLMQLVTNNYHQSRSGDIHVIFSPQVFINDLDGLTVASMHGSPWQYDTYVPVIFAGANLTPQTISRFITPYDIAPTIASYLAITPPSGSSSPLLQEVISRK